MTNCRHLILFLIVQKILASFDMTTVFSVTTEGISQNSSVEKFELQPDIIILLLLLIHNTRPVFFFQKELRQFFFISYGHATTKKVSHKVDETECRWAKCAPSEGNSCSRSKRHPCECCRPTSLSCRLPLSVQKQNFSSVVAASGFFVSVTEDSSVKTKRGKLSVEMTDQPFATK